MDKKYKGGVVHFAAFFVCAVITLYFADVAIRPINEIKHSTPPGQIATKVGDYVSLRTVGALPVFLAHALNKWPDRSACLERGSQSKLRWAEISGAAEIEVCLTRVLSAARELNNLEQILEENGFKGGTINSILVDEHIIAEVTKSCTAEMRPCGFTVPNFWGLFLVPYGFNVEIKYRNSTILDVYVNTMSI